MADDNKIEIQISAETTGLNTGLAQAKTSIGAMKAEVGGLSDALAEAQKGFTTFAASSAGIGKQFQDQFAAFTELDRQLKAGVVDGAQAAQIADKIDAAFAGAAPEVEKAGVALTRIGLTSTQAANGARALFDELASGRKRQAFGTFTRLAIALGEVNPAAAAAVAGIVAVGAALAATAIHAERLDAAFRSVTVGLEAGGRSANLSRTQFQALIAQLSALPGISTKTAEAMTEEFARAAGATSGDLVLMSQTVDDFAAAIGEKPAAAAKKLITIWNDPARALTAYGELVSAETITTAENFLAMGDKADAARTLIEGLGQATKGLATQAMTPLQRATEDLESSFGGFGTATGMGTASVELLAGALEGTATIVRVIIRAFEDLVLAIEAVVNAIRLMIAAVGVPLEALAAAVVETAHAMALAATGNFTAAYDIAKQIPAQMSKGWNDGKSDLMAKVRALNGDLKGIFVDPLVPKAPAISLPKVPAPGSGSNYNEELLGAYQMTKASTAIVGLRAQIARWQADIKKATDPRQVEEFTRAIEAASKKIEALEKKGAPKSRAHANDAAREQRQEYEQAIAGYNRQVTAASQDWDKRRALMQAEADLAKKTYGERSTQYQNMLSKIERAQAQHDQKIDQQIAQGIEASKQASLAKGDQAQQEVDFERQLGTISASEALTRTAQLANQTYAIERKALMDKWELWDQDPQKRAQVDVQLEALERKHQVQMKKLQDQQVLDSKATWQKTLAPIDNAFSTTIRGVIQGTETLRQAMARMAQSMVLSFVEAEEKKLTTHLATELAETSATEAGAAARTAAEQAGHGASLLSMAATAIKAIANDAASVFSGIFAFLAPTMGPFAAIPAAAGAAVVTAKGSSIVSAAGGYDIPAGVNPIAQLHASEMVLPASLANSIRAMTGMDAGSVGTGEVHIHGPLVQAIDAQTGAQFLLRNSGVIAAALAREFRNANAALAAMSA